MKDKPSRDPFATGQPQETPSVLRNRFANWKTYAAAAGATVAMSTGAQASIISSGTIDFTVLRGNARGTLSIDGLAIMAHVSHSLVDRNVVRSSSGTHIHYGLQTGEARLFAGQVTVGFSQTTYSNNIFPIRRAGFAFSSLKLAAGDRIDFAGGASGVFLRGGRQFSRSATVRGNLVSAQHPPLSVNGPFGPGNVTGFVGFHDVNDHYGWLEVEVSDTGTPGFPNELQILGYAYDTVAGEGIIAGDTGATTPEPGTAALGLLALGAAGIAAWRRRRAESAPAKTS